MINTTKPFTTSFTKTKTSLKKLTAVALCAMVFASTVVAAGFNDNDRPTIRLLKDNEVIQSREMTEQEFSAYQKLNDIEHQFEILEVQLETFEEQMEEKAEKLELVVEAMIEQRFSGKDRQSENLTIESDFDDQRDTLAREMRALSDEMKPQFAQIRALGQKIKLAANHFKDEVNANNNAMDFDALQIVDDNDKDTLYFGNMSMDLDDDDFDNDNDNDNDEELRR